MTNQDKKIIKEFRKKINERFFDLHIRGCKIIDVRGKTQKLCDEVKEDIKKEIENFWLSKLSQQRKGIKKVIRGLEDKKFPRGGRMWCVECAKRIKKEILKAIEKNEKNR